MIRSVNHTVARFFGISQFGNVDRVIIFAALTPYCLAVSLAVEKKMY